MEIELDERGTVNLKNDLSRLGFTLSGAEFETILARLPEDIVQFVNSIFVAEGFNPDAADRHLWRQVRDAVVNAHNHRVGG